MIGFNINKIREDFPILNSGKGIIYFDSACMSLKPRQVVEKMNEYYYEYSACGGRSGHKLSQRVVLEVDNARSEVRKMINAKENAEIIFTRNATEGINLVANSLGLKAGDEVIVSDKEHNSNLIPWLKLKKIGVQVNACKSNKDNTFNLENFKKLFTKNTKLVAVAHVSNLDGVENPVKEICKISHKNNSLVLIDGAQSFPHMEIDVRDLDVDFFAFSGHKALGPTGVGVLYGKKKLLEKMDQFIVGGQTVMDSTCKNYDPEILPRKYEAGLQDYAGIIGFGEACKYLQKIGLRKIGNHVAKLNRIITDGLKDNKKIKIVGPLDPEKRNGIFTFYVDGMDSHNVAKMLDSSKNICVRSGAFCVHSWFNEYNVSGAVRASLYFYNTEEEAKIFVEEVKKILKLV